MSLHLDGGGDVAANNWILYEFGAGNEGATTSSIDHPGRYMIFKYDEQFWLSSLWSGSENANERNINQIFKYDNGEWVEPAYPYLSSTGIDPTTTEGYANIEIEIYPLASFQSTTSELNPWYCDHILNDPAGSVNTFVPLTPSQSELDSAAAAATAAYYDANPPPAVPEEQYLTFEAKNGSLKIPTTSGASIIDGSGVRFKTSHSTTGYTSADLVFDASGLTVPTATVNGLLTANEITTTGIALNYAVPRSLKPDPRAVDDGQDLSGYIGGTGVFFPVGKDDGVAVGTKLGADGLSVTYENPIYIVSYNAKLANEQVKADAAGAAGAAALSAKTAASHVTDNVRKIQITNTNRSFIITELQVWVGGINIAALGESSANPEDTVHGDVTHCNNEDFGTHTIFESGTVYTLTTYPLKNAPSDTAGIDSIILHYEPERDNVPFNNLGDLGLGGERATNHQCTIKVLDHKDDVLWDTTLDTYGGNRPSPGRVYLDVGVASGTDFSPVAYVVSGGSNNYFEITMTARARSDWIMRFNLSAIVSSYTSNWLREEFGVGKQSGSNDGTWVDTPGRYMIFRYDEAFWKCCLWTGEKNAAWPSQWPTINKIFKYDRDNGEWGVPAYPYLSSTGIDPTTTEGYANIEIEIYPLASFQSTTSELAPWHCDYIATHTNLQTATVNTFVPYNAPTQSELDSEVAAATAAYYGTHPPPEVEEEQYLTFEAKNGSLKIPTTSGDSIIDGSGVRFKTAGNDFVVSNQGLTIPTTKGDSIITGEEVRFKTSHSTTGYTSADLVFDASGLTVPTATVNGLLTADDITTTGALSAGSITTTSLTIPARDTEWNRIDLGVGAIISMHSSSNGMSLFRFVDRNDTNMITIKTSGAGDSLVALTYNGGPRLDTTNDGVDVTGNVNAESITTTGALNAGSITTTGALNAGTITTNTNHFFMGDGNVGIGTTSPTKAKLEVSGSVSHYLAATYYNTTPRAAATEDFRPLSAYFERHIATQELQVFSDKRIKENIVEIDDGFSLQKVRDISCVWYNYKDKISRGGMRVVGFIAQQVKEHLPEAISLLTDVIPNEMRKLENVSWNGFDISGSDSSGSSLDISGFNMSSDLQDVSGVKYRFYLCNDISDNEVMKEVVGNEDNTFTFDQSWNNVFCYGKEVDDFHTLDKQKLLALNFSATQEIDRIQQEEKTKLLEAQNKINTLETQNAELLTKLEALEKRLTDAGI